MNVLTLRNGMLLLGLRSCCESLWVNTCAGWKYVFKIEVKLFKFSLVYLACFVSRFSQFLLISVTFSVLSYPLVGYGD